MQATRNDVRSSQAYMSLKRDEAEEFDTLPALATKLGQLGKTQKDHRMELSDLTPKIEVGADMSSWSLTSLVAGKPYDYRQHSIAQYCSEIGFPSRILERCPAVLARMNLAQFSMLNAEKKLLVRTEGGDIRAVLSGSYKSVNHIEITNRVMKSGLPWDVNFAGLSAKRMFMLLLDPTEKFDGPDGSQLSHCTYIGNSETGEGSYFAADLWYD